MDDIDQRNRKIGVVCSAVGALGFLIGIFMNFNRSYILFSDCVFFIGIFFILGINRAIHLFTSPKRVPATGLMTLGIIITFFDHGFYGGVLQLFGAFLIFGGFLPHLFHSLSKLPAIGPIFRVALPSFFYEMNEDSLPR